MQVEKYKSTYLIRKRPQLWTKGPRKPEVVEKVMKVMEMKLEKKNEEKKDEFSMEEFTKLRVSFSFFSYFYNKNNIILFSCKVIISMIDFYTKTNI